MASWLLVVYQKRTSEKEGVHNSSIPMRKKALFLRIYLFIYLVQKSTKLKIKYSHEMCISMNSYGFLIHREVFWQVHGVLIHREVFWQVHGVLIHREVFWQVQTKLFWLRMEVCLTELREMANPLHENRFSRQKSKKRVHWSHKNPERFSNLARVKKSRAFA